MRKFIVTLFVAFLIPCSAIANPLLIIAGNPPSGASGATLIFDDGTGFESPWSPVGNPGNWDSFSGTPTSEGTVVAKGSVSMSTDAAEYMIETLSSAQTEVWSDFWFRIDTAVVGAEQIWKLIAT